jgi:myo-inositol-1(or 4)-monophosphatase
VTPPDAGAGEALEDIRAVAVAIAREAGSIARADFGREVLAEPKGERGDVVTRVDREAEALIVAALHERFPEHAVWSEEGGAAGPSQSAWRWEVDPLDGTNNFVLGLPLYGVCLTLVRDGAPILSVIHDAHHDATCSAVAGAGARREGRPLAIGAPRPPVVSTVSWLQGYAVPAGDPTGERCRRALERTYKRVLRTWAPSVDWALLAAGRLGAVVAYRNEPEDLNGGLLLALEAGAQVAPFAGGAGVVAAAPEALGTLVALLDSGAADAAAPDG